MRVLLWLKQYLGQKSSKTFHNVIIFGKKWLWVVFHAENDGIKRSGDFWGIYGENTRFHGYTNSKIEFFVDFFVDFGCHGNKKNTFPMPIIYRNSNSS